ncbi:lipid-transfer protein [Sporichthya brevicatena]|uniref:Lipid-transfer protein n=1 Tax=Sporichthya brevicatena TaxID=171442 RepID=A0ABP3RJT6_9ACTN
MRGSSAVIGIGESPYYRAGRSPYTARHMAAMAVRAAVEDAGISPDEVDGIVTFHPDQHDSAHLWSWLGLGELRWAAKAWGGGGNSGAAAVQLADAAVTAGYARNVIVFRALNQGTEGRYGRYNATARPDNDHAFTVPFGAAMPVVKNALLTRKFLHQHRISQDALADIALASYEHAQYNPRAIMYGKPLTREAYHASRWIAEPLHLYDCCQESDGACALIVSSASAARVGRQKPAYLLAGATGMPPRGGLWGFNDDAYPSGRFVPVGRQLWERAGVGPGDVDVAQFYENFTGTTLIAISDIGFAPPEELEKFVSGGRLHVGGGGLPINTSGGNLAEAYIHGLQLMVEAVRQIRGTSTRQVTDARLSLFAAGPGTSPSSAVLLSAEEPS